MKNITLALALLFCLAISFPNEGFTNSLTKAEIACENCKDDKKCDAKCKKGEKSKCCSNAKAKKQCSSKKSQSTKSATKTKKACCKKTSTAATKTCTKKTEKTN